jgi:hypothetical protein
MFSPIVQLSIAKGKRNGADGIRPKGGVEGDTTRPPKPTGGKEKERKEKGFGFELFTFSASSFPTSSA